MPTWSLLHGWKYTLLFFFSVSFCQTEEIRDEVESVRARREAWSSEVTEKESRNEMPQDCFFSYTHCMENICT